MKQFLSVDDAEDPAQLVREALALKKSPLAHGNTGEGKTLGLLFFNPSLRTRLSTQKAALNLGMSVMVMNVDKEGWKLEMEDGAVMNEGSQEHVKDAVKVISRYCDIIGVRTFAGLADRQKDYNEEVLGKFIKYASVPIISLESATRHPLQSLADMITIEEHRKKKTPKVVLSWAPHPRALPQAVPNSFAEWMQKADVELVVTHPEGYELDERFTAGAEVTHDQDAALHNADFVYAKNWSGFREYGRILCTDDRWMITPGKMALTANAKFMHCLPIRRNVIATDEVVDGSLIYEQAENRIYSAQVVLKKMLEALL